MVVTLFYLAIIYSGSTCLAANSDSVTKKIIKTETNIYYNGVNVDRAYLWTVENGSYVLPVSPPTKTTGFDETWALGTTHYTVKTEIEISIARTITAPSTEIEDKVAEALIALKLSGDPGNVGKMNADSNVIPDYFERYIQELNDKGFRLPTTGHLGGIINNLAFWAGPLLGQLPSTGCLNNISGENSGIFTLTRYKRIPASYSGKLKGCGQQADYVRECLQQDIAASRLRWVNWRMTGEKYAKFVDQINGPDYYPQTFSFTHQWGVITPGVDYGPWFLADPWKGKITRMTATQKAVYVNSKGFSASNGSWKDLMVHLFGISALLLGNQEVCNINR